MRILAATTAAGLLAVLPACGKSESRRELVQKAIRRTRSHVSGLVYTDTRPDLETSVRVVQADDFRYKARVSYDGEPAFDEVTDDDILAVRFVDPNRVDKVLAPSAGAEMTELSGISTVQALQSRRWVVDVGQAPFITAGSTRPGSIGKDPVADALQALDYADAALLESISVERFNPDSIAPVFTKAEDDLPKPADGETRYDLRRPSLPNAAAATSGQAGELAFPATKHFRKMAIYLRDGMVTRVVEHVGMAGKTLRDTISYERTLLREVKAPAAVRNELERAASLSNEREAAARIFEFVNVGLRAVGQEPVLVRNMSLEVTLDEKPAVETPTQDVIKGNLGGLVFSATAKAAQQRDQQQQQSGDANATAVQPGDQTQPSATDDSSTTTSISPSG